MYIKRVVCMSLLNAAVNHRDHNHKHNRLRHRYVCTPQKEEGRGDKLAKLRYAIYAMATETIDDGDVSMLTDIRKVLKIPISVVKYSILSVRK